MDTSSLDELVSKAYNARLKKELKAQWEYATQALRIDPSSHVAAALAFFALWDNGNTDQAASYMIKRVSESRPKGFEIFCYILSLMKFGYSESKIESVGREWLDIVRFDSRGDNKQYRKSSDVRLLERSNLSRISLRTGEPIADTYGVVKNIKTQTKSTYSRWSQPIYHIVESAAVVPQEWYVVHEDYIFIDETLNWPTKWSRNSLFIPTSSPSFIASHENKILVNLPNERVKISEPCILLGSHQNFYYWLTVHLARLRTLDGVRDFKECKILVDQQISDIHFDALSALSIPEKNIVKCDPNKLYQCKELIVPGLLSSVDVLHTAGIDWLRRYFGPKTRDGSFPDKVFISRSKAHRRKFTNEREVEDELKKHGYTTVTPDALNFSQQTQCVQNADSIIGPYGTCLSVALFAPQDCKVYELIDEQVIPLHRFIENISVQIGQEFRCVLTNFQRNLSSENLSLGDFTIEPENLLSHLELR